jgi:ATP-dependent DNA ligase
MQPMTTQVIFPPRPKGKMNPTDLPDYEASGRWCAQRKFNGCRNLIHITPEGQIEAFSRYGDTHKAFALTTEYVDQISSGLQTQKGTEYWLDSEVMTKTTGAGGEIVFYDILQAGRYLFGRPHQMERLRMLRELCGDPQTLEPGGLALEISPKLWLAQTFTEDFVPRFKEALNNDSIEGLVLRKKKSTLDHFGSEYYETGWVIRCRKPNKNYNL